MEKARAAMAEQALPIGWKSVKFENISSKCTAKNRGLAYLLVLTNSAQNGIISQKEHFDKEIAVEVKPRLVNNMRQG